MSVVFQIKGRLGNAIFRYLGCSFLCLKCNLNYQTNGNYNFIINDEMFKKIIDLDSKNFNINIDNKTNYLMNGYYQHDIVYRKYKDEILKYMKSNIEHFVLTDGVNAGDGNIEKFYIKDIIHNPTNFNKFYDLAIHIRLGDKVDHGTTLSIDSIKNIISKINIPKNSCLIVNKPKNTYEQGFINDIKEYIKLTKNISINIESNDIITDYHIMRNSKVLVCSISTISWCAAFLSTKIVKCYMPDYPECVNKNGHCKYPIENTELYNYT
tara:strand:- start:960 stop:1760 length:801 start_codon:yes stop_codon:yes gene_type:complete